MYNVLKYFLRENLKAKFRAQQVLILQEIDTFEESLYKLGMTEKNTLFLLLLASLLEAPSLGASLLERI